LNHEKARNVLDDLEISQKATFPVDAESLAVRFADCRIPFDYKKYSGDW
jgi:hypothetical protein